MDSPENKEQPLVSVLVVCRNALADLRITLDSVRAQTFTFYETVVVDGASTDGTPRYLKQLGAEWREQGRTLRWISEPDAGIYDAMNKALALARGQYVWYVNAGDAIYDAGTLQSLLGQGGTADVFYGPTVLVDAQRHPVKTTDVPDRLTPRSMRWGMAVSHQSFLVRRALAGPYDTSYRLVADHDWILSCLVKATSVHLSSEPLSRYLLGGLSDRHFEACWKEKTEIVARHFGLHYRLLMKFPYAWACCKRLLKKIRRGGL